MVRAIFATLAPFSPFHSFVDTENRLPYTGITLRETEIDEMESSKIEPVEIAVSKRQRELTAAFIRRIAELKIKAYGWKDTPEEYVARCHTKERVK